MPSRTSSLASNDVWAVGSTSTESFESHQLIEHWDGQTWSIVPVDDTANSSSLNGISGTSSSDIWAVCSADLQTLAKHWDGSTWTTVASPTFGGSGFLLTVDAQAANDVWALGFHTKSGLASSIVLHWDGNTWTVVDTASPPPPHVLFGVSASASDDAWIAGQSIVANSNNQLVEHWDGNSWQIVRGSEPLPGSLSSVIALSPSNVWVSGDCFGQILHWDGSAWTTASYDVGNVRDFSAVSDDVWGAGTAQFGSAIVHWDGSKWSTVIANQSGYGFSGISAVADGVSYDVWAVRSHRFEPSMPVILHRCAQGPVIGGISCDGKTDVSDALWGLYLISGTAAAGLCENSADVNCDTGTTPLDIVLILKYSIGLLPRLVCTSPA